MNKLSRLIISLVLVTILQSTGTSIVIHSQILVSTANFPLFFHPQMLMSVVVKMVAVIRCAPTTLVATPAPVELDIQ